MITFLETTLDQMELLRKQLLERREVRTDKGRAFDLLQGIASNAKECERLVALKSN